MSQEPIFRIVSATVESATEAVRQIQGEDKYFWNMKLKVTSISNYALPCSMPREWADRVVANQSVQVKLRRGRIKANRDGSEPDGTRDFHWWWELEEWQTKDTPTATGRPAGQAPVQGDSRPLNAADDRFRTREEIRLTDAYKMAVRLAPYWEIKDIEPLDELAMAIYHRLESAPVAEAPTPATPEFEICGEHNLPFNLMSGRGAYYHVLEAPDASRWYCVKGQGLVPAKEKPDQQS